jgi:sRNA-binding protein
MDTKRQAAEQLTNGPLDISYLISTFPQCFFLHHECRRPLKIGLLGDLLPLLPFTEAEIQAVLRRYTRSDGYLHACTEGAIRIDVRIKKPI